MKKTIKMSLLFIFVLTIVKLSTAQGSDKMYAWGSQEYGQLGNGEFASPNEPVLVDKWVTVAAGAGHTVAINSNGELYSWGLNSNGQLGLGNTTDQSTPQRVGTANNWISIAAGYQFTIAINSSGELYAWGRNFAGQLGIGNTTDQNAPQKSRKRK